ncbi:DUF1998 domain-containing protein, partial [Patescibacteria group bacterium]|nr:DUF1998 domain-containing protein [Patescibacteria group bacterium]
DRDTFNFFTDEGLIPNYAFPEAGVILRSVIYRKKQAVQEGERNYDTWVYEYERSAVSAIAELAPENQFYAGGRKVKVDQIDMTVSDVETWRLCNNCSHAEMVGQHGEKKACPKCGSLMWADEGQKATMLRMRTVFATSEDRESRIGDDSDDREPTFYNKHILVDFEQKDCVAAYRIDNDELPFGFEFIRKATFREINFGEKGETEKNIRVAGTEMPSRGFTVCRHCGKVQNKKGEIKHAYTCPSRDKDSEKNLTDCLFLYRDFSSEAIRMLLPVTTFSGADRKLHSFVASLHLGLKQKFGGNIDHLQTTVYEEPVPDSEYRKKYLVLYDTVPGGTGYLKELTSSEEKLMEVFEKALNVLKACSCNQDAVKDGCYRCLYAYRSSYNMSETSRSAAVELLSDILRHKENLVKTASIADIKVNALFDSELEALFIKSLEKIYSEETSVTIKKELVNGKPGYFLKIGEQAYNIEPQVLFGNKDNVSVVSKADFVFWPAKKQSKRKPVVVFLDGWEFHKDRIGKDMAQRMAFPQSGAYHVWSLTWRDVDSKFGKVSDYYVNYLDPAAAPNKQFSKLKQSFKDKVEYLDGIHSNNSFDWFIQFLENPNEKKWSATAFIYSLMYLEIPPAENTAEWANKLREGFPVDIAERCLSLAEPRFCGSMDVQGLSEEMPVQIFAGVEQSAVNQCDCTKLRIACLLDDSDTHLKKTHAESSWTGFLRLYNLFQFISCSYSVTDSGMSQHAYDPLKLLEVGKQEKKADEECAQSEWLEIRDYIDEELHG